MNATDLADTLKALAIAYVAGGLRKAPPSLAILIKDLQAFENATVAEVGVSLQAGQLPKKKATRVAKPKPTPNAEVVSFWVQELRGTGTDEASFVEAVARLEADKRVRPAQELPEILSTYSEGSLSAKTKPQRLKLLTTAFHQRVRATQNEDIAAHSSPF